MTETEKNSTPAPSPQKPSLVKKLSTQLLLAVVLVALGAGSVLIYQESRTGDNNATVTERQQVENDGNELLSSDETTISNVANKVSPSVVSISTEAVTESQYWGPVVRSGAGSGFIVSKNGVIVTNRHVVENARQVQVVLSDGTTYDDVEVVVTDPLNDLAYLKIPDVDDLPVVELGDSTTVKIGQRTIAIGNSLGQYQNTVTSGIISATGRPIAASNGSSVESLNDLLQTDAAINPGNSGGPLLNASGQVIGVNTAIAEDAEGIGFAIPVNAVKGILKQVLAGNSNPKRAFLGISYLPINAQIADERNLSVKVGAMVYSESGGQAVAANSPAAKAGLKSGDVITKINDVEVGPRGGVSSLVAEYAPGDTIEIAYVRGDDSRSTKVTLGEYR